MRLIIVAGLDCLMSGVRLSILEISMYIASRLFMSILKEN